MSDEEGEKPGNRRRSRRRTGTYAL